MMSEGIPGRASVELKQNIIQVSIMHMYINSIDIMSSYCKKIFVCIMNKQVEID